MSSGLITCFNLTDINQPSELIPLLRGYILPYLFATLAILLVCTTVIVVVCIRCFHEQCLACCFQANPPSSREKVIRKRVCSCSRKSDRQNFGRTDHKEVTAQSDSSKSTCTRACSWQSFLRVVCCLKTQDEEEARKRLEDIEKNYLLREL